MYCKWRVCLVNDQIKIGCKTKSVKDWDLFFASDEEYDTPRDTQDFKRIQACYLAYKAYLIFTLTN